MPLQQVSRFARLAAENLDLSKPILASIGQPVQIKQTVVKGSRAPLDQFAVAVAATLSLMLVTLLLAAGLLALEREEDVFARLVRGLVSRGALLAEKIVLAAGAAFVVTLLQVAILSLFVASAGAPAGSPRWRRERSPSPRSGRRSARSHARSASPRCWRSCWRCRSRSSP